MDHLDPQQFLAFLRESKLSVEEVGHADRLLVRWKQDRHAFTIRVRLLDRQRNPDLVGDSVSLSVRHAARVPMDHPKAAVVYHDLLELRPSLTMAHVRLRAESGEVRCQATEWMPPDTEDARFNSGMVVVMIEHFAQEVVRVRNGVRRAILTGNPAWQRRLEWLDRGIAKLFSDSIDQHAARPEAVVPPIDTPTA